jgi:agmatine deiminase
MKKNVCRCGAFLLAITAMLLTAQISGASEDYNNKIEHHRNLAENAPFKGRPTDDPPPQPASAPAEWEPATGVLITYPLQIPMNLVADMSQVVEVMSEVTSASQARTALIAYANGGVDTSHCSFLLTGYMGPYTRDHGPWYMFNGNGVQGIMASDYWQQIPLALGDTLGIPVYVADFSSDGGNYMTDGMGRDFSTTYLYTGNPWMTQAEVNANFEEYLGITSIITTPHPWGGFVPHIDTHAKLLDPDRLLVIQPSPPNTVLESNVQYWSTLLSAYGRPYEIIRVPGTGYSNSLFLNDHVFMAFSDDPVGDSTALAIFREALPGYTVEGYNYPSFVTLDALHCRTHEMADRFMLRIVHVPAFDQVNSAQGYLLKTKIHCYSNTPFINGTPVVKWKLQGSTTWNTLAMTSLPSDSFSATIPAQADNSLIQYYLHAEDGSGRSENHPTVGPANPHHFSILPANPLAVDLNPQGAPIVIPPGGGSFTYTLTVTNTCSIPVKADLWSGATLPNGHEKQILLRYNVSLPSGVTITRNLSQNVPGSAPAGSYTYWCKVGLNPQSAIWGQDAFPFTKTGMNGTDLTSGEWDLFGWEETQTPVPATPLGYCLLPNYPNPFNALTTLVFSVPQMQRVKLSVYDAQGRLVTVLVDGYRAAGVHEVTFEAGSLASGVYFCQLQAGDYHAVLKLVLLK